MAENKATEAPPLTIESILTAVQGVAWRNLGELLFSNNESYLDEIEAQYQSDDERLHALIDHWLQGEGKEQPSWRALIYNLDLAIETEVADKIRQFAEPVSDSTLTVDNVLEVMGKVRRWEVVGDDLEVPDSKLDEIKEQSSTEIEKSLQVGRYWVNTHPDPSWEELGRVLYLRGEETAAMMVKQYLPPQDSTLTVDCVLEVMGKVQEWYMVGDALEVPESKLDEINEQSSTEMEKSHEVGRYWVKNHPDPSWEKLGRVLYQSGEETAAMILKQYLPPQDSTLTVDSVLEVMGKVQEWYEVGHKLGAPFSKLDEIKEQSSTEIEKSHQVGRYWVNAHPDPSWEKLGQVLYESGEETAAVMVKQYLPPQDSTLTVDSVLEVMGKVQEWYGVGRWLEVPVSKLDEIKEQSSTEIEKSHQAGRYWVNAHPDASWEKLGEVLYWRGEETAAMMVKQYLPPQDSTLTVDSVLEVMGNVQEWELVGGIIGLGIPDSKLDEIKEQSSTEIEKSHQVGRYWVNTHPNPSWEELGKTLYLRGEETAAMMVKQYLPPQDPTLTTDNLIEVIKEEKHRWEDLASELGLSPLGIHGMDDVVDEYVRRYPTPSWKQVALALQEMELHKLADEVTTKYVRASERSQELFEEAMSHGYVEARDIKALIFGVAGSGKSHTIALLMDEEPPTIRKSTPCATRPIRAVSRTRVEQSGEKWVRVTSDDLSQTIADTSTVLPQKVPVTKKTPSSVTSTTSQEVGMSKQHTSQHPPSSKKGKSASSVTPKKLASVSTSSAKDELLRRIEMSPYAHRAKRAFKRDQISLIDTGGQPQFHEVLPMFMRYTSACMFTIKLCDDLDAYPLIEYFDGNGKRLGTYRSKYTNRQILMRCMRVIQSQASQSDECFCPAPIFVGTRRDLEGQCPESRDEKNRKICEMLLPAVQSNAIYRNESLTELIFPVNALNPGSQDQEVAAKLRQVIVEKSHVKSKQIPLRWHGLELALQKLMLELGRGVLSKAECLAVAQKFHFNDESFEEALKYLHNLNVVFYYNDVLPNIIFCDSQVLLDKVTQLVEYSYRLQTDPSQHKPAEGKLHKFRDQGIVTEDFLGKEEFAKHYVPDLFGPVELLSLFKKLLIVSQITEKEYLMPCLLTITDGPTVSPYGSVPSLLFYFPHGPLVGVFCALVAYLLSQANWKLLFDASRQSPVQVDRSTIQFAVPGDLPGKITLSDSFSTYFQVSIQIPKTAPAAILSRVCPNVCETIMTGIRKASSTLHYNNSLPKYAFLCNEHTTNSAITPHASVVDDRHTLMTCTSNPAEFCSCLTVDHLVWFGSDDKTGASPSGAVTQPSLTACGDSNTTPTASASQLVTSSGASSPRVSAEPCKEEHPLSEDDLVEITDYLFELDKTHIYHLGLVLGLSHHRVKGMKDSETFLDDMIAAWLQKVDQVGVPTWQRLVKALRHKRVGQTGIANEIERDKLVTATHE